MLSSELNRLKVAGGLWVDSMYVPQYFDPFLTKNLEEYFSVQ